MAPYLTDSGNFDEKDPLERELESELERELSQRHSILSQSTISVRDFDGPLGLEESDAIFRLYELCHMVSYLQPNTTESTDEPRWEEQQKEASQTWEEIRNWFNTCTDIEERRQAAEQRGEELFTTPLHLACRAYNPPFDVIQRLIECCPESVEWCDNGSWLPLHYACAYGSSVDVLQVLIEAFPGSRIAQDRRGRTPLHFAILARSKRRDGEMSEAVRLLSEGGATELMDEAGMLPFHIACAFGTSTDVLQTLAYEYPDSIYACDPNGKSPLHFAMVNATRDASPAVVDLLLAMDDRLGRKNKQADRLVNKCDHNGNLSLYLLAVQAQSLKDDMEDERENTSKCLRKYLSGTPLPSAEFLTALQCLPDWLRFEAVVNTNVQRILSEKIGKRFPTLFMIADGVNYILSIGFLWGSYNEYYKKKKDVPSWCYTPCLLAGSWFLFRELLQIVSLVYLGRIGTWYSPSNCVDLLIIALLIYFTFGMMFFEFEKELMRTGVSITILMLFYGFISYLTTINVGLAVFVKGLECIVQRLRNFLAALLLILILFAFMFEFVFRNDHDKCPEDPLPFPDYFYHCQFWSSFIRVLTMLMGEVRLEDYTDVPFAFLLYLIYTFLVVILLSNFLIAIVTDAFTYTRNDRSEMVFWSSRLDFVAEIDAIHELWYHSIGLFCSRPKEELHHRNSIASSQFSYVEYEAEKSTDLFRETWTSVMSLFDDHNLSWFSGGMFKTLGLRVLACCIVPLWVLIGGLSFGLFLPPQIREKVWSSGNVINNSTDAALKITQQMDELRAEVRLLRDEVAKKLSAERDLTFGGKHEIETVKEELMTDLKQVKEIMSTLLSVRKMELGSYH